MAVSLPTFPAFQVHLDGNVGPRWKKWLARFENLIVGMGIDDAKQKRALLLHYSGPEVDEIFDTLEGTGEDKDYKTAVEKLTAHFNPQVNTTYEVYNFRKAKQNEGESLDGFHTRLRTLAKTGEFANADKEIKEQIILSCKSNALRRKALREDLDLTALLKAGRALELSDMQAKEVESDKTTVNTVNHKKKSAMRRPKKGKGRRREEHSESRSESRKESRKTEESSKCRNCGGAYPHKDSCPANNKKCTSCGKFNHFAKVCRTVPPGSVKRVTEEDTDEEDYVYAIGENKQPMCSLEIDGEYVELMLDSGASVNLIDEVTYQRIYKGKAKPLEQSKRRIFSYGSPTPLPLLGTIHAEITARSNSTSATLHVVKGSSGNLLGYDTAQRLKLLKIVNQVGVDKTSPQYLASGEFENLFGGIGKVKGKVVKLHIDPDVQPKQQPHRRIPFHVRQDVEKELERLESLDIIEKVTGPTPWVSPIVVVPKSSGEVRLCVPCEKLTRR